MHRADEAPAARAGALVPPKTRGAAGFFRVGPDDEGRWWLRDPDDQPFFARGVYGVTAPLAEPDSRRLYDPAARLRSWGFNLAAMSRDRAVHADGLPFLLSADFCSAGPTLFGPGLRLPDVFDLEWPRLADDHARKLCAPLADCRELVGWVTDDELDWAAPSAAGRPSLLQLCLSLEPSFAAYHAAWEFVLAHHGGQLDRVAQAWNAALPNKETLRELTRAEEGLGTRGYLRDEVRWAREFARRYFGAAAQAIRAADANHLVFGCRFRGPPGPGVLMECVYPAIDVTLAPWTDVPGVTGRAVQPVLADGVRWPEESPTRLGARGQLPRLTSLERMLRKGRASLERLARHPAVVGYVWSQWQDNPGEQPPFAGGLIHVNGNEAREHTELLTSFNRRVDPLRRTAR